MQIHYGVTPGYFFWSLLLGCMLAFVYDILRAVRRIRTASVLRIVTEDILFLLTAGVLLALFAFQKNDGRLRWQGVAGGVFGAAGYYFLFRNDIVWLLTKGYRALVRILTGIIRVLLFPIRLVFRVLHKPIEVAAWYCGNAVRKTGNCFSVQVKKKKLKQKRVKAEKNRKNTVKTMKK